MKKIFEISHQENKYWIAAEDIFDALVTITEMDSELIEHLGIEHVRNLTENEMDNLILVDRETDENLPLSELKYKFINELQSAVIDSTLWEE